MSMPPVLEARLDRERTLEGLATMRSESEVRRKLAELNERLLKAVKSPAVGPGFGVPMVDIELTVREWRAQRQAAST